ncbi:MAG: hypothetical protein ACOWWO_02270 [Peptococcaceae bacterium]
MIKLLLLIIFFIVAGVQIVIYINKYILLFELKRAHASLVKLYSEAVAFNQANPLNVLNNEIEEIRENMINIETVMTAPPKNSELEICGTNIKQVMEDVLERIKDKKEKWQLFADFKDGIDFKIVTLNNIENELKGRARSLKLTEEKNSSEIDDKVNEAVQILNNIKKEYVSLDKAPYHEFNFYILDDIANDYAQAIAIAELASEELRLFGKRIRIFISSLVRKSTFYLTLEEATVKRRNNNRLGEISVSFKTYKALEIGSRYKKDVAISGKRTSHSQHISLLVRLDEQRFNLTMELEDEQFARLFQDLAIAKENFELDESNLPLELNLNNLELLVCEKEQDSFAVNYYIPYFNNEYLNLIKEGTKENLSPSTF